MDNIIKRTNKQSFQCSIQMVLCRIAALVYFAFCSFVPPVSADWPTNGHLALLGTAFGDYLGTYYPDGQYRDPRQGGRLLSSNTHRAAVVFRFFSTTRGARINALSMARDIQNVATDPRRNGAFMWIAPVVAVLDSRPNLTDDEFVDLVRQTVQASHHQSRAIAADIAIALAARSSIDYRERDAGDFARLTIERIRRHIDDYDLLQYLNIVERNLNNPSHFDVMAQLNLQHHRSARRARETGHASPHTLATSNAAAVLYFLFRSRNQLALIRNVQLFTTDQDAIGPAVMALSVLRTGGFRQRDMQPGLITQVGLPATFDLSDTLYNLLQELSREVPVHARRSVSRYIIGEAREMAEGNELPSLLPELPEPRFNGLQTPFGAFTGCCQHNSF